MLARCSLYCMPNFQYRYDIKTDELKCKSPDCSNSSGESGKTYIPMILTEETLARYRANQGYVYLVHAVGTDRYKIGRSVNPVARLEQLKGQSPYPLQIIECFWSPDAIADEKALHSIFASARQHGEWFEFYNFTTEEKIANDYALVFTQEYEESVDSFQYYSTHDRPQIRAIAKAVVATVCLKFISEIPGVLNLYASTPGVPTFGKTPQDFLCYQLEDEFYWLLWCCNSLDSFIRACRFAESDWCQAVRHSFCGSLDSLDSYFFRLVVTATVKGFAASIRGGN